MATEITEVRVYWDSQDGHNEGWAYKASSGERLVACQGIEADTLSAAIEATVWELDLPLTVDDFGCNELEAAWAKIGD
jgi:hypothetical protein